MLFYIVVRAKTFVAENQGFDVLTTQVPVIGGHAGRLPSLYVVVSQWLSALYLSLCVCVVCVFVVKAPLSCRFYLR